MASVDLPSYDIPTVPYLLSFIMQESDLRNRLSEALKSFNLKQVQVARDTGINNATLSLWLSGKIKGSTAKLDVAIEAWLNTLSSTRPKEPVVLAADCSRFHRLLQRVNEQGTEPSELVPIRIDVEKDGRRVHEAFCWDVQEPYFTPETFAALLCEDLSLPQPFQHEIADSIRKQMRRHERYRPMIPQCLKTLEIDLVIDNIAFKDRFVWDINNRRNSPEAFAQCVCADMGLGPEIATALAHAIREQVTYYQKKEQMRGSPVVEQLTEIYRANPDEWEPKVLVLSPEEVRRRC